MIRPARISTVTLLSCALAFNCFLASMAQGSKESLQQSWWLQFQQKESALNRASPPAGKSPAGASVFTAGGASSTEDSPDVLAGAVQKGYFTVPAYFGTQPTPYERPVEIFRSSGIGGWGGSIGGITPFVSGIGPGWGGMGFGLGGIGRGLGGIGPGWGGMGFGRGGFGPGWGGMGFGLGGLGLGLAGMGLGMGGIGPGWGGWGCGMGGPGAWQTAPSKPSGNYFAPSTVDTTASGSYYATTTPAQTPMFARPKPITNFWGSGSPFGRDASMPWNR